MILSCGLILLLYNYFIVAKGQTGVPDGVEKSADWRSHGSANCQKR